MERMDPERVQFGSPYHRPVSGVSDPREIVVNMDTNTWRASGQPLEITVQIMEPQQETTT